MDSSSLKKIFRVFAYGIFGFIIAIVFIRVMLKALGANPDATFVNFWYDLSYYFVSAFAGIYPNLTLRSSSVVIEIYSVIAMMFYTILGGLTYKALSSVAETEVLDIIKNIVDFVFKGAESLLIVRFILKLTGASTSSLFVDFVYKVSFLVYEPFKGILPAIRIPGYNILFETSTLIAIIVIVIFDIITEGVIVNIAEALKPKKNHKVTTIKSSPAAAQHITINIPQPQQAQAQPTYVDHRTVQVFPGSGQNNLEGQRPQVVQQLPQYQQPTFNQNYPHSPNQNPSRANNN